MLPTYAGGPRRPSVSKSRINHNFWQARSRLTNAAVLLLLALLSLSFLLNLKYWISSFQNTLFDTRTTPPSIVATLPKAQAELDHLIVVAGHAIWKGGDAAKAEEDDEQWVLEDMQRGGAVKTFVQHIRRGVELNLADEKSLLVFSGGQTRPSSLLNEGTSYHLLASSLSLFPPSPFPFPRATSENHALDSFQNLLFSLARFREVAGRYPARVTVVGYGMKQPRFEELHRTAIGWAGQWEYVGVDDETGKTQSWDGERQFGYVPYTRDPYGCHPPLSTKRLNRNPFWRAHSYHLTAPELAGLLEWCPENGERYPGRLPWDGEGGGSGGGGISWGREVHA